MNIESYQLEESERGTAFAFVNEGLRGSFQMGIQYQATQNPLIWNLGFGVWVDFEENGQQKRRLDDRAVLDNGNRNQVIATVIKSLFMFWEHHPDKLVFLTGSTDARTRLYRGVVNLHGLEVSDRIDFFGIDKMGNLYPYHPPGSGTEAFILRLR